jgi:hypothetical protein
VSPSAATLSGRPSTPTSTSDAASFPQSGSAEGSFSSDSPVRPDIPPAYRQIMRPVCGALIDNADRLGRLIYRRSPIQARVVRSCAGHSSAQANDGEWRKDPALLTDAELASECCKLEALIGSQKAENRQARAELDILDPAVRRYDLEKQFVYIELMNEETGLLSPSHCARGRNPA